MPPDLIIDGYNLMHLAGLVRLAYGPGGFEKSRQRLLKRIIKGLTEVEVQRTTVVFDAREAPAGGTRMHLVRGLRVIYSPAGQEADDVIEDLIARHLNPTQLVVVSSDNRLIKAIRRRQGTAMSSETFLEQLDSRTTTAEPEPVAVDEKPSDELDAEELTAWLREFQQAENASVDVVLPSVPVVERFHDSRDITPPVPAIDSETVHQTLLDELEAELKRCLEEDELP